MIEKARSFLAPYGPDGGGCYFDQDVAISYHAFHTTSESSRQKQPYRSPTGCIVVWDGRLDNRKDLITLLAPSVSVQSSDVEIVAAAYEKWGIYAFAKLLGDWALCLWKPRNLSLILARDFMGTRHLYYSFYRHLLVWSTVLDPLLFLAPHSLKIEEEYLAGWLALFPPDHLTPYKGIYAVPCASFVQFNGSEPTIKKYWDFNSTKTIRYSNDHAYEEHFLTLFTESVRRRLRANGPILAELSGGMDSSSIVCVADTITGPQGRAGIETVSFYDDGEPNWNEKPFFELIEQRRGRAGLHIDVGLSETPLVPEPEYKFTAMPGDDLLTDGAASRLSAHMQQYGFRIVLSGIGGDETLGGVPTAVPELADLLTRCRLIQLTHRLKSWALHQRKPWTFLLTEVVREFIPLVPGKLPSYKMPPRWLDHNFLARHAFAFQGYERRLRVFGPRPSFQDNLRTLDGLRRQLGCLSLRQAPPCETRYPYLDRCLLEFLYAIPREQLLRPGQRRSLMRRSLAGIVPREILDRRRKAFVSRNPLKIISREWHPFEDRARQLVTSVLRIVDPEELIRELGKAQQGQEINVAPLLRLVMLERWLQSALLRNLLSHVRSFTREP
ncbi:MAG: hypothetical protein JST79_10825 [Acidobacteria bacterium]|nr:hypothetical protein [Acidobacteriota bacterium]